MSSFFSIILLFSMICQMKQKSNGKLKDLHSELESDLGQASLEKSSQDCGMTGFQFFFFFFIYHPKILKVYKTTTTVKLEYTKEIMSFVARKDTRSSSSHYERHITKI